MKFYTSYNPPPSKVHEPCPKEMDDFIKDESTGKLVPCGKIPVYERIQSYHDSTTLSSKLKRFAMGDSTALGGSGGAFGNFTEVPSDLRAVLDARKKVGEDFNALPSELRGIFSNSFEEFEKSVRDGTAEQRIREFNARKPSNQSSQVAGGSGQGEGVD